MQASTREVTVIPATVGIFAPVSTAYTIKKRVAAYARVSTDSEEQLSSYEAQVDHYTRHIQSNDKWTFVSVYTDEGITATNTKKRDGFKRMIKDALEGKIDLIVTKSVSRFARNTVDTLTTVRQLKEKGVEVYFEKENIYTLDSKGELLITIMSSLAQEESRSISENVTWGQRKRMQDGKVSMPYKNFLGYEKGKDGIPKIVESEAETVRNIYHLFLSGKTPSYIAGYLTSAEIPTPAKKATWRPSTVLSILQNEKYKGDALLQKTYTTDFLTKKQKTNEGEVPQYYVANSHPAIIQHEIYDLVQEELKKRKTIGRHQSGLSCFSSKVICGECGGFYGSKVWHSTSKYRRKIWRCNHKYKNGEPCRTPHLYEVDIQKIFVEAFNRIFMDKERLLEDYNAIIQVLTDTAELDNEIAKQKHECEVIALNIRKCIEENARTALNQDEYQQRYDMLTARYTELTFKLDKIQNERQSRLKKRDNILRFIAEFDKHKCLLTAFDEELWYEIVDSVTVRTADNMVVRFKDGSEIHVNTAHI